MAWLDLSNIVRHFIYQYVSIVFRQNPNRPHFLLWFLIIEIKVGKGEKEKKKTGWACFVPLLFSLFLISSFSFLFSFYLYIQCVMSCLYIIHRGMLYWSNQRPVGFSTSEAIIASYYSKKATQHLEAPSKLTICSLILTYCEVIHIWALLNTTILSIPLKWQPKLKKKNVNHSKFCLYKIIFLSKKYQGKYETICCVDIM